MLIGCAIEERCLPGFQPVSGDVSWQAGISSAVLMQLSSEQITWDSRLARLLSNAEWIVLSANHATDIWAGFVPVSPEAWLSQTRDKANKRV